MLEIIILNITIILLIVLLIIIINIIVLCHLALNEFVCEFVALGLKEVDSLAQKSVLVLQTLVIVGIMV